MKLTINGYEVEIKVKSKWNKRTNKADTMAFLNMVSIWAGEAAMYNVHKFGTGYGNTENRASDDIYNFLDANGCYDNLH